MSHEATIRAVGGPTARTKWFVLLPDLLREAKVPGAKYTKAPEFGQPLLPPEEAREHVEYFGGGEDCENTVKTLEMTNDAKYPFYLRHKKRLVIYVFDVCAGDVRE